MQTFTPLVGTHTTPRRVSICRRTQSATLVPTATESEGEELEIQLEENKSDSHVPPLAFPRSRRSDDDEDDVDLQQPKARKKPNTRMGRRNQRCKRQFGVLPTVNQQAQPPI